MLQKIMKSPATLTLVISSPPAAPPSMTATRGFTYACVPTSAAGRTFNSHT